MNGALLNIRQAYSAMLTFLEGHYKRTRGDELGSLLGGMSLVGPGAPLDEAHWAEWEGAIETVLKGQGNSTVEIYSEIGELRGVLTSTNPRVHPDIVNANCVFKFPELKSKFGEGRLQLASAEGPYVFHEQCLCPLIYELSDSPDIQRRVGEYVEDLLSSRNRLIVKIAVDVVLKFIVASDLRSLAPHLSEASWGEIQQYSREKYPQRQFWFDRI